MQKHVMTFRSFQEKRVAIDHINENVEPDNLEECLTEKKLVFFTGIELQPKRILHLQKICKPHSYKVSDY